MKALALCLSVLGFSMVAQAAEEELYKVNLNWDDGRTLEDSVVMMCDDTYYSGFQLKVPGTARKDFVVEMDVDVTSGKLIPGCQVKSKVGRGSVTYTFSVEGSCTIKVHQLKGNAGQRVKSASYDLFDAC